MKNRMSPTTHEVMIVRILSIISSIIFGECFIMGCHDIICIMELWIGVEANRQYFQSRLSVQAKSRSLSGAR